MLVPRKTEAYRKYKFSVGPRRHTAEKHISCRPGLSHELAAHLFWRGSVALLVCNANALAVMERILNRAKQ